jgi:UDP-2,3-diacylglucosamine hydrolase
VPTPEKHKKLGLIAGNGSFPLLLLDAARAQGTEVVVAAIKEETSPLIEQRGAAAVHWLSLGELGKLIDTFKREGVHTAVMAGQVKHKQIFSGIRPDWRLAKVLFSLGTRNTDSLIGAVAKVLEEEGIHLISSTSYLEPLLAKPGVLTRRAPTDAEQKNVAYGRRVAFHLAHYDIGQTVVIAESACVAVEAMEGTDATILRAGEIMKSLEADEANAPGALAAKGAETLSQVFRSPDHRITRSPDLDAVLSRSLTVVKVAKPNQDMRFDVPVIGVKTIETMAQAGATCLAVDAGKCLFLDADRVIQAADQNGIAIVGLSGMPPV